MKHYVNKFENDWDDYVDYAVMVHRATAHTTVKYSPYYLVHGRDLRMPNVSDLSARMEMSDYKPEAQGKLGSYINTLE
jgi:hypothetical protein